MSVAAPVPNYAQNRADPGRNEQGNKRPGPDRPLEVLFPTPCVVAAVLERAAGGVGDVAALVFDRIHKSTGRFACPMGGAAHAIGDSMHNGPDVFRNIGGSFA
jgi:hypothetical protein